MNNLPDSEPILENGTGTPYLAIFDGSGDPIMDPQKNKPIGIFVSSFKYSYIEEDADEGEFVIDTDNPELSSHPKLQYNQSLKLQWGYIFPTKEPFVGPVRSVIIVGNKTDFTDTGVKMTISFADSTVLAKNIPATYKSVQSDWDDITRILSEVFTGFAGSTTRISDYRGSKSANQGVIIQTGKPDTVQP